MATIKYDLSQYYPMKAVFERILGEASFRKVKDCGSVKDWKFEIKNLLKAISISIKTSIEVVDDEWIKQVNDEIELGLSLVESSVEIDEVFAALAATLTKITFLQIGFLPTGRRSNRVKLIPQNWKLNLVRTVQYVQNSSQKETQLQLNCHRETLAENANSCNETSNQLKQKTLLS